MERIENLILGATLAGLATATVASATTATTATAHPGHERPELHGADAESASENFEGLDFDLSEHLTVSGIIVGAYQFQEVSGAGENAGAITIRPSFDLAVSDLDHFHATVALAGGNQVNDVSPFSIAPWAADLEDDLRDINGSGRDFLQTAWYRRTFGFEGGSLNIIGGIIDSSEYLDQNAFANDEYVHFMNEVFVNSSQNFLPSYDVGLAMELSSGAWSVNAAVMRVSENEDGNDHLFAGVQVGHRSENAFGEVNHRLTVSWTDDECLDPSGMDTEGLLGLTYSYDQMVSEHLGIWARAGLQDDSAAVAHDMLVSLGLHLGGSAWGRPQDELGVGYGWLEGGNTGVDRTQVAEAYMRFGLGGSIAATLDVQYIDDAYDMAANDVDGLVLGGRLTVEF
ncbi:MAG: carbohydrate porin [Phycisphaerales bacterium]